MSPLFLLLIFIVSSLLGYRILSHVPSLLHTPLMSSMNALDGVIILGALTAAHAANSAVFIFLGTIGIVLAITNVIGGFDVTHKMLRMVAGKKK